MRVLAITAGAANTYCGSCLRDNTLAAELLRQGHDITLVPIYTPTRTDEPNVSEKRVLYGGVNVYLQQNVPLFRRAPRFIGRLFDSRLVMALVGKLSVSTDPGELGSLTVSTLEGEHGVQRKEVSKLVAWVASQPKPDVVVLPNCLMLGLAAPLARAVGAPIACTLQGEDLFLDGLPPEHRSRATELIRAQVAHVDLFMPVSRFHAESMGERLAIPAERMRVVPLGINLDGYAPKRSRDDGPFRIGFFARIAPEKGLHNLVAVYQRLCAQPHAPRVHLEVGGYLAREQRAYLAELRRVLQADGLGDGFHYHGELDRRDKIRFLRSLDVFSLPTGYDEPKGLSVLEAMAAGVPVVLPRKGAFAEILEVTGGGRLIETNDPESVTRAILELLHDEDARRELGHRGAEGVRRHYSAERMAEASVSVFMELVSREERPFERTAGAVTA